MADSAERWKIIVRCPMCMSPIPCAETEPNFKVLCRRCRWSFPLRMAKPIESTVRAPASTHKPHRKKWIALVLGNLIFVLGLLWSQCGRFDPRFFGAIGAAYAIIAAVTIVLYGR